MHNVFKIQELITDMTSQRHNNLLLGLLLSLLRAGAGS